jgi:hypothetical protein
MAPADSTITRRLNKGETLKIREYVYNANPTLAGTHITSTKPIAVTVTEPVGGDASGDQIVPVNSLGTRHIVPRTYLENRRDASYVERFYLVAAEANTTVNIYATVGSPTPTQTIPLNDAGSFARYNFPTPTATDTVFIVYVESDKPVYLYQRGGFGEEGSALLPSIYAIQQTQLSFYQVYPVQTTAINPQVQKGFLIFREGAHDGFTVTYGEGGTPSPLALTPLDIPFVDDLKIARFSFDDSPTSGRVVKVQSAKSAFSLGYITGNATNNNTYGYFSSFGTFEFPAVTYLCGSSVTLHGGYAETYLWTFPDGVTTRTTPSIDAPQEGLYKLVMDQDGNTLTAYTTVRNINAGSITSAGTTICTGETPDPLSVAGAIYPSGGMTLAFQWQSSHDNVTWTDIPGETSSTYAPGPLTRTTWYRWKITADLCADETEPVRIKVSSCTLPVNPHLMIQYK